jgi:hypothetical protein
VAFHVKANVLRGSLLSLFSLGRFWEAERTVEERELCLEISFSILQNPSSMDKDDMTPYAS